MRRAFCDSPCRATSYCVSLGAASCIHAGSKLATAGGGGLFSWAVMVPQRTAFAATAKNWSNVNVGTEPDLRRWWSEEGIMVVEE